MGTLPLHQPRQAETRQTEASELAEEPETEIKSKEDYQEAIEADEGDSP